MKKILLLVMIMISVISLGACASSDDTAKIEELETRLEIVEANITEVEQILIDLEIIEGLNNQREYYLPQSYTANVFQGVYASTYEVLGDELDKTKAPGYVLDINGDYIPFNDVANMLVDKYYGTNVSINNAMIGATTEIILESVPFSQDEFIARTVLLIEELSLYDFYIISSSQLVIQTQFGSTARITIPIATLRSSFITMNADIIISGTYEIQKIGLVYDSVQVKNLYNQYVADLTFDGYILDYN